MDTKDIKIPIKDLEPSKTFCIYPWTHSYQGCQYERKLCCISNDVEGHGKMPTDEFWNSEYMQDVRKQMLTGEEVSECEACYKNERLGIKSLREEANENLEWHPEGTKKGLEQVLGGSTPENTILEKKPNYYDYRTIHCNLQCVSCGVIYSSTHINLAEEMWGVKHNFKVDKQYEEDMAQEMIEGLNEKRIDNIYWAGGEPFMQPLHWKVIEHMVELLKTDEEYVKSIKMHYNTNLTKNEWKKQNITEILEPFQPSIQASLDGTHETIEYTRDGCNWPDIQKHWKEYNEVLNKNEQMGVATVMSAPVLFDIERYLEFYGPYDPFFHPHYMFCALNYVEKNPGFLDIRFYPEDIFYPAIEKVEREMKASGLRGSSKWLQICDAYKKEYPTVDRNNNSLQKLKGLQNYRELFLKTKRTLSELYDITNPEASQWLQSIEPLYINKYIVERMGLDPETIPHLSIIGDK